MWQPRTLLITDPNLADAAYGRLSGECGDLTSLSWDVQQPASRARLLEQIAAGAWELAISFYSDLILSPAALAAIRLPLNIHPALPCIRGVGHDVAPLVEHHASIGATLHRMDRRVDSGEIFHVHEVPLPPEQTFASLRLLNQSLSLQLLDVLRALMAVSRGVPELEAALRGRGAMVQARWGPAYYSRKMVAELRARYSETVRVD